MEDFKNKLSELLNKREWSEEEKQWLQKYLNSPESDVLQELMRRQWDENVNKTGVLDSDLSAIMLNRIHEQMGLERSVKKASVVKIWTLRIAVAASMIGLFFLGTYFWFSKEAQTDMVKTKIKDKSLKDDVLPGGDKAVLTLADGTKIILDDAQNGALVEQGATKVIKLGGKLAYNQTNPDSKEVLYNIIATPRGGQYQIELPDGSQVWLNAASSLRFPTAFVGKERRVEITGEAYFEVAKNKALPFIVGVNGAEVQVLGTHFNVMAYKDEAAVKTTLLEGSVQFVSGSNKSLLKPGQQSHLTSEGGVKVVSGVDVEEVMAWKNGMFHFEQADIETVLRQLARWYDVEVVFKNKKQFDPLYADIPRNTKLSDVLKALELSGSAKFEIEGKKIIVMQQ